MDHVNLHSRVTDILGYRPVDLLGKVCYDFYIKEDVEYMMESYEQGQFVSNLLIRDILHDDISLLLQDLKRTPYLSSDVIKLILVLKLKGQALSIRYHFKHANGEAIQLRSSCNSFQNPYTDEAEYIVCTNNVVKYVMGFIYRKLLQAVLLCVFFLRFLYVLLAQEQK